MPVKDDPVVIKKYANRRLYNMGTSTYVTLEDLAGMVKRDEEFVVQDAKSGEDITHSVLTQIIFELENDKNGQRMLPVPFLRKLISFYGDQMQMVVPSFLEQSMTAFARERARMREAFAKAPSDMPRKAAEEQTRRNIAMFRNAMHLFSFTSCTPNGGREDDPEDFSALRERLAAMQRQIDAMSKG